jgi:hypothetical protein
MALFIFGGQILQLLIKKFFFEYIYYFTKFKTWIIIDLDGKNKKNY